MITLFLSLISSSGIGGHIHHFGVVLAIASSFPNPPSPLTNTTLMTELLRLGSIHHISSCGMLGGTLFGQVALCISTEI
jgi:hypothetical protein